MLRKVMVGVIAVSIVAAGCSSDPTQSDEYQQLESQLTEVQSQVADAQDAASETAAATQAELEGLRADVARLDGELTEADANNLAVSEAMVLLTQAFETVVAFDLFIGSFEGDDADGSFLTLEIGPTGSDRKVDVDAFDDGSTMCLDNFGEMSPLTVAGVGTRLDSTQIELTADFVCHTGGENKITPDSPVTFVFEYDPSSDVVIGVGGGACLWRPDGGSAADCP